MKLTAEELDQISSRLCNLATECHFMYDSAKLSSHLIGCYDNTSGMVVVHLRDVLRRVNHLLDDLHCVEASLDDLLVKDRVIGDSGV